MDLDTTESLSERIAQHIANQIINGELVEGEHIQEMRLVKELDVSRGSVREALLILERTYLIEIYPRRGAVVSSMSSHQVRALFDAATVIIGAILQRTAQCLNALHIAQIQQLITQLNSQVRSGDIQGFYDLIFAFFKQQSATLDNPYLSRVYAELAPSMRRSYVLTLNTSPRELQDAASLFRTLSDAVVHQTPQIQMHVNDFLRHLSQLVLDSLERMKQIELAWLRRSKR